MPGHEFANAESKWTLGPFSAPQRILESKPDLSFECPVLKKRVLWASKDVFNPGAVVRDGKICLLVRAEDNAGRYAGTSRIGLATSSDGYNFDLHSEPVIAPADDCWQAWEWPGGCEDPRVVESPDGNYVCLYTAFDGKAGCLFVATSPDLRNWTKHGPAFGNTAYVRRGSKSGAVVTELNNGRLTAARIDGKFWMYWGEGVTYAATSDDLVHWTPVEIDTQADRYLTWVPAGDGKGGWSISRVSGAMALHPLAAPRRHRFDSLLTEPGPPAVRTEQGIVLLYNGANHYEHGDPDVPPLAYQPGQMLFDSADPRSVISRTVKPFLHVEAADAEGQVGNVCFAQGLVAFKGSWWLYMGLSDSRIGVSTAPMQETPNAIAL